MPDTCVCSFAADAIAEKRMMCCAGSADLPGVPHRHGKIVNCCMLHYRVSCWSFVPDKRLTGVMPVQYFVTPSSVWPADAEEKGRITEGYRAKLGQIDCKWFDHGEGSCPFGTSCFYRCGQSRPPLIAPVCLLSDALWLPQPCHERHLLVLNDRFLA